MAIKQNIAKIIDGIPSDIQLIAATKSHSVKEIEEAISAGIKTIGENYVQEAKQKYEKLKGKVKFHLIGHLQANKVKDAVEIFGMIQTVDSLKLAKEINKRTKKAMPVLIEINIAYEKNKSGVFQEDILNFLDSVKNLKNLQIKGIMTMCPILKNPEDYRQYFRKMKNLFEKIKSEKMQNIEMEILSMGMSDSYRIAIEEGSTMIRLGRVLFNKS